MQRKARHGHRPFDDWKQKPQLTMEILSSGSPKKRPDIGAEKEDSLWRSKRNEKKGRSKAEPPYVPNHAICTA
ncbi:hypothetical protein NDU88_009580 [Pleurodeles waltl]|uniref:Uncharacterized protein n=1 Tax=Pleurodeles waltl TaxID=8319 RepID=A0AAV7QW71_PLEWA|nr:hypothetical protein NDU88_009580 [Pleurodeles waltl]